MKICYCFPGWGRSGGARVVGEHINRLQARGHYVAQVPNDGKVPDWFDLHCETMTAGRARSIAWDVVVATNPTTVHPALLIGGSKMVYFVQMAEQLFFSVGSSAYEQALKTYKLAAAQGFHAITIANWLNTFLDTYNFASVHQVPNGVNEDHFYREDYPRDPGDDYILIEGDSRNHAKDTAGLSWKVGIEMREEFGVKLKGVAAVNNSFVSRLDEFVLCPTEADYRRLYSGAVYMLKASHYEGRSLAPLEAMACGCPTVRAIEEGDDDLVHRKTCLRTGYDYKSLLSLARLAMRDRQLIGDLRDNVLQYTRKNLRWEPIITRLEALFGHNQG